MWIATPLWMCVWSFSPLVTKDPGQTRGSKARSVLNPSAYESDSCQADYEKYEEVLWIPLYWHVNNTFNYGWMSSIQQTDFSVSASSLRQHFRCLRNRVISFVRVEGTARLALTRLRDLSKSHVERILGRSVLLFLHQRLVLRPLSGGIVFAT